MDVVTLQAAKTAGDRRYAVARALDMKVKGALGNNGAADDSAAFLAAAVDYTNARGANSDYFGATRYGQTVVEIPPGIFKITTAGALMRDLTIAGSRGLKFRGAGRGITYIVFAPTDNDVFLCDNNNDWAGVSFEGITFISTNSTASFMRSTSTSGIPQDYAFINCEWGGTWKYGLQLVGGATNSEMTWDKCVVGGDWTAFFYSGTDGSDQQVNYNFFATTVIMRTGNFIDVAKGGNINVWGGNFIHLGDGTADQTFFMLRGGDHASGVQRLFAVGIRIEHRHAKSHMIYSEWKRGNITFLSIDTDTSAPSTADELVQTAYFIAVNDRLPVIVFDGCTLMGYHEYPYTLNNQSTARRVTYRNCDIISFIDAADFIVSTKSGTHQAEASRIPASFEDCRGRGDNNDGYQYPFDCVVGWETSRNARPKVRQITIANFEGGLADAATGSTSERVKLPIGSRLTRAHFTKPAGGVTTTTAYTYTLYQGATSPTVVAKLDGSLGGIPWNQGFDVAFNDLNLTLTDDESRTLTLVTDIPERSAAATCLLTYTS